MAIDNQYVLCFGKDELLLETRRHLLEQSGHAVLCTSDESRVENYLLSGNVSLLVLCHTLTQADVDKISRFHSESHSTASILCLTRGQWKPALDCLQSYDAQNGPAAFIAVVNKLSGPSNQAARS